MKLETASGAARCPDDIMMQLSTRHWVSHAARAFQTFQGEKVSTMRCPKIASARDCPTLQYVHMRSLNCAHLWYIIAMVRR